MQIYLFKFQTFYVRVSIHCALSHAHTHTHTWTNDVNFKQNARKMACAQGFYVHTAQKPIGNKHRLYECVYKTENAFTLFNIFNIPTGRKENGTDLRVLQFWVGPINSIICRTMQNSTMRMVLRCTMHTAQVRTPMVHFTRSNYEI